MTEVKVSFYLKRNEEKTDGTTPILGRISIGKSMVQFSAKVSVPVCFMGKAVGNRSDNKQELEGAENGYSGTGAGRYCALYKSR
jgi:hypothetical protein